MEVLEGLAQDAAFEAQDSERLVTFSGEAGCVVWGDESMIRSGCENVVRNALLYAPEGKEIRIGLVCEQREGRAVVSMRDEGAGGSGGGAAEAVRSVLPGGWGDGEAPGGERVRAGDRAEDRVGAWGDDRGAECGADGAGGADCVSSCGWFGYQGFVMKCLARGGKRLRLCQISQVHGFYFEGASMKITLLATAALALSLSLTTAYAQKTVTGRHGSTATGTASRSGATVNGSGTATGAKGNSVSASGSATRTRTGTSDSGLVTGPKGGTTTVNGTTTNNGSSSTVAGTVTGPQGKSKSGSTTVPK